MEHDFVEPKQFCCSGGKILRCPFDFAQGFGSNQDGRSDTTQVLRLRLRTTARTRLAVASRPDHAFDVDDTGAQGTSGPAAAVCQVRGVCERTRAGAARPTEGGSAWCAWFAAGDRAALDEFDRLLRISLPGESPAEPDAYEADQQRLRSDVSASPQEYLSALPPMPPLDLEQVATRDDLLD
jgi:hypothetical protein